MSLTDFKERAVDWLTQQGLSTVLLIAVLIALSRGVPYILTETKGHIEAINSAHGQNIERISESFDRATDAFNKQAERDRQLLESVIQQRSRSVGAVSP